MALWVIKPGKHGQREEMYFEKSIIAIGWEELPDLSNIDTRDELKELYSKHYPNASKGRMRNHVGQILAFIKKAKEGDLVAVTHKTNSVISIGKITGQYEYREDFSPSCIHARKVKWLKKDIPRNTFKQDLLYSFGAFMTFCQVSRNNAEERVEIIVDKNIDIGIEEDEETEIDLIEEKVNLEEIAEDQIREVISRNFKGHDFEDLIAAILRAKGFITKVAPSGADDGVDILASSGIIGFDEPKICVQVKSQPTPIGISTYRNLKGALDTFKGKYGLLVCWGGFKSSVIKEARKDYFKIRLWNSKDVLQQLYNHFNEIEPEYKVKIPLKQIWVLSEEEE